MLKKVFKLASFMLICLLDTSFAMVSETMEQPNHEGPPASHQKNTVTQTFFVVPNSKESNWWHNKEKYLSMNSKKKVLLKNFVEGVPLEDASFFETFISYKDNPPHVNVHKLHKAHSASYTKAYRPKKSGLV